MIHVCTIDESLLNLFEFILKLLASIGAIILFWIGYSRYKKDQKWKRCEFVAKEMNEFSNDKMVRNVMYMLDWGARKIELFPNKEKYSDRFASVNTDILNEALVYHKDRIKEEGKDRFNEVEVAIRDNFDQFLNYLERFDNFIVAGLINKDEIEPYLRYWLDTISIGLNQKTRNTLTNFIIKYEFKGTIRLLNRFNIDISNGTVKYFVFQMVE